MLNVPWRRGAETRRPTPRPATGALELDRLPDTGLDNSQLLRAVVRDLLMDRRLERRARLLRLGMYALVLLVPALIYLTTWIRSSDLAGWLPGSDTVGMVRIDGEIAPDSQAGAARIVPALRRAFESSRVKAVVLAIDSPGGSPAEAERIYVALTQLRREHPKPVVAVIQGQGASAAYMVAMHCERIYAGRYSLVGSIGALLAGWDAHQLLGRLGVEHRLYASGELKSMMNPFVPMSGAAQDKARELVAHVAEVFAADVQQQRRLAPGADLARVTSGAIWEGEAARRLGLVDEIATLEQVLHGRWEGLAVREYGPGPLSASFGSAIGEGVASAVRALSLSLPRHAALR